MSDLKPCPFCGSKAHYGQQKAGAIAGAWYADCLGDDSCAVSMGGFDTEAELVGAWNRRAHDATETAALGKVRDLLAEALTRWPAPEPHGDEVLVLRSRIKENVSALDAILKERE